MTDPGNPTGNLLEAELAAAAATAPADPTAPGSSPAAPAQPSEQDVLAGYAMIGETIINSATGALLPAWSIAPDKKHRLAGALAQAALLWFPDGLIPPKYLALLTIAGITVEIINDNRDPKTGALRPARYVNRDTNKDTNTNKDPAAPDPYAPIQQS